MYGAIELSNNIHHLAKTYCQTSNIRHTLVSNNIVDHSDVAAPTTSLFSIQHLALTHWGRDKMDAISQTTFSSAFSWKKMLEFRLYFHWNMFLRVQLSIFHHWLRQWLGPGQATSHYLNQWWLINRRIYASLGLNELMDWAKTTARRDENHLSFGIHCVLFYGKSQNLCLKLSSCSEI